MSHCFGCQSSFANFQEDSNPSLTFCNVQCQKAFYIGNPERLNVFEAGHLKILEAKHLGQYYFLSEDRFVDRDEVPGLIYNEEYSIADRHEYSIKAFLKSYRIEMDRGFAQKLIFGDDLSTAKCLNKWTPIRILGGGNQGRVYQMCKDSHCHYAAKISTGGPNEIEMYRQASNLGVAPTFFKGFMCDGKVVIISEKYEGDLYTLLRKPLPNDQLDAIFEQVFTIIYRLLREAKIMHNDTKACNFLYKSPYNVKLGDYGISTILPDPDDWYYPFLKHIGLFMDSLREPDAYGCHPSDQDPFDLGDINAFHPIKESIKRIISKHPEWELTGVKYVGNKGGD